MKALKETFIQKRNLFRDRNYAELIQYAKRGSRMIAFFFICVYGYGYCRCQFRNIL